MRRPVPTRRLPPLPALLLWAWLLSVCLAGCSPAGSAGGTGTAPVTAVPLTVESLTAQVMAAGRRGTDGDGYVAVTEHGVSPGRTEVDLRGRIAFGRDDGGSWYLVGGRGEYLVITGSEADRAALGFLGRPDARFAVRPDRATPVATKTGDPAREPVADMFRDARLRSPAQAGPAGFPRAQWSQPQIRQVGSGRILSLAAAYPPKTVCSWTTDSADPRRERLVREECFATEDDGGAITTWTYTRPRITPPDDAWAVDREEFDLALAAADLPRQLAQEARSIARAANRRAARDHRSVTRTSDLRAVVGAAREVAENDRFRKRTTTDTAGVAHVTAYNPVTRTTLERRVAVRDGKAVVLPA
ncbi:MAG: hypothetical protein HY830_11620 [Actinobacteria bacterium]|nr:hypothetical protein [Actinomycetota bacterium]